MFESPKSIKHRSHVVGTALSRSGSPPLSRFIIHMRKWRIRGGDQATQTGRDCHEAVTGWDVVSQGMARIDAIREVQITKETFYRCRKQYGGMGTA